MVTFRAAAFVLFILTVPVLVSGQAGDEGWGSLGAAASSKSVIVVHAGGEETVGSFVSAEGTGLSVRTRGRTVQIARDQVAAVYLARMPSRLRRGLIGGLAGAGAGFLIGGVAAAAGKTDPLAAAAGVLIGLPAGAVIGAATGKRSKGRLLYTR